MPPKPDGCYVRGESYRVIFGPDAHSGRILIHVS